MNTYDNGLAEGAEYLDRIYKNDTGKSIVGISLWKP